MHSKSPLIILVAVMGLLLAGPGCSNGTSSDHRNPLAPSLSDSNTQDLTRDANVSVQHSLLGLYSCRIDPDKPGIEMLPLRDAVFHLNALRFLEPPPPVRIVLSNFEFDGEVIDVDVQFVHPFEGFSQFTGFDVCGIVITCGNISGFSDPDLVVAGEGDTRLINPDGLTRWWNPREFPYNEDAPFWGYIDGSKGTPDEIANYTATLNGYKYHADGLSVYDDLIDLDPSTRGSFSAGSAHTRHYTIEIDSGLVFNYAVDACWVSPDGDPPIIIPDSFPESANREEPWLINVNVTDNNLYYDPSTGSGGGELLLDIDCYDWFHADENTVRIESPGVFDPVTSSVPVGGTDVYSTYHVEIIDPVLVSTVPIEIWVSAEAGMDYDGFLPGKPTATYLPPIEIEVSVPQLELVLVWDDEVVISHGEQAIWNDIEPATIVDGEGQALISFFFCGENEPGSWFNCPKFVRSLDQAHTFGSIEQAYWWWHGADYESYCRNGKYCLGSNGQSFHSYQCPSGHGVGKSPWSDGSPYQTAGALHGTYIQHAGEMLYTSEGYPMMFGDRDGIIKMRLGAYPNEAGTNSWPTFGGTAYTLVEGEPGNQSWLSLSRSALKTSDGICHLMYWNTSGYGYIRMISTTDISGASWTEPVIVFAAAAEIWVGGRDPGLWIDDNDGFHMLFSCEDWMGNCHLLYGYSADGTDWDEGSSFKGIMNVPVEDGLNDTQIVIFDAFDFTWVFLCYETAGNVWCRYKKIEDEEFSEPIQVNEHAPASLPDFYPNGDVGLFFAYEADDGTGSELTDIFYRLAEFKWQ